MSGYKPSVCQSCGFSYMRFTEEPCNACVDGDHWISKVSKITNPIKIDCDTCRFTTLGPHDDPCCNCIKPAFGMTGYTEWKPSNQPSGKKVDLVVIDDPAQEAQEQPKTDDPVDHPGHYTSLPIETIKAIKLLVTEVYGDAGYKGYCFGNELKYRLRAGFKGPVEEEIGKALKYREFREDDGQD